MEPVETINERLKNKFGLVLDKPRYRLVWSTSQLEKRFGIFNDFYGDILVRSKAEVREVPKYPAYPDRWVLEVVSPAIGTDVANHNGYEPLFVFDNDGKFLDPAWRAIEFILGRVNAPIVKSPSDIEDDEQKAVEAEEKYFYDYLTDQETIGIKEGYSIVVPGGESNG
jgi:hypothetical protein